MRNSMINLKLGGKRLGNSAFSLIELVIVVVIIAIIGAIAIPKMSRGAAGASDAALIQDLSVLRSALDLFQTENGGVYPTAANVVTGLTGYSDGAGNVNAAKTSTYIYGPYLKAIPALPVAAVRKGQSGIGTADGITIGWIYVAATGSINANTTTEADTKGTLYNTY